MGKDFVREILKERNVDEIWMIARRGDRLDTMAAKEPGRLREFTLDLTEMSSFDELKAVLAEEKPQILYLVNSAGAGRIGRVDEIDEKEHAFVVDINVRALTCMSRICLPYLKKGSRIIQLCSGSSFLPQPEFASYAASKAYVRSFSRALGQELKKYGVTVTSVCPGPVKTEFFEAAGKEIAPAKKGFLVESKDVVKQAMKDAKSGKALSIYSTSMKLVHLAGKILPTRVVLSVMDVLMAD